MARTAKAVRFGPRRCSVALPHYRHNCIRIAVLSHFGRYAPAIQREFFFVIVTRVVEKKELALDSWSVATEARKRRDAYAVMACQVKTAL